MTRRYSFPRRRITRWLATTRARVPRDIRAAQLASLYEGMPIYIGGVINALVLPAIALHRQEGLAFAVWMIVATIACAMRAATIVHDRRAAMRGEPTWTDLQIFAGCGWAASLGFGTFISMMSGDWLLTTMVCVPVAAMVGGMCLRNYGAPRLVAVMIALGLGPMALATFVYGDPLVAILGLGVVLYAFSMTKSAYQLSALTVATMRAERDNDRRARHDQLTGLLNRAGLARAVEDGALLDRPDAEPLTLFYVDLDAFKPVNDRLGHEAGDQVLRGVARRLRALANHGEVVARIGGDEFVILSAVTPPGRAARRGEEIVQTIARSDYVVAGASVRIGASVGVSMLPGGGSFAELLRAADSALYGAKARGGRVVSVARAA